MAGEMSVPEVKASGVNSVIDTLRSMAHPDSFERFVAELPPRSQALVRHPPIAMTWVPLEDMAAIFRVAHQRLFAGLDSRMEELGRKQMRSDLVGIYRFFLRFTTPAYVIGQTSKLYATYARSCGQMRILSTAGGRVDFVLEGRLYTSTAFWRYFVGNVLGIVDHTRVSNPTVALVAGGGDENWAHFIIRWH